MDDKPPLGWNDIFSMKLKGIRDSLSTNRISIEHLSQNVNKIEFSEINRARKAIESICKAADSNTFTSSEFDRLKQLREELQRRARSTGKTIDESVGLTASANLESVVKSRVSEMGAVAASAVGAAEGTSAAKAVSEPVIDIGPLAEVLGKSVVLGDLTNLKLKSGDRYFSTTVQKVLFETEYRPDLTKVNNLRVVTPITYLWTAIIMGRQSKARGDRTANEFLSLWLESNWAEGARKGLGELSPMANKVGDTLLFGKWKGTESLLPIRENFVISAPLVAILGEAAKIAQKTQQRQKRTDARHILAAFLLDVNGLQAFADLGLVTDSPKEFFDSLSEAFLNHLVDQATKEEKEAAWRDVFSTLDSGDHFSKVRLNLPVTVHYPEYASDTPCKLANDQLDVADDARALADLICLTDATPPLAIGLFGNWGAGKSTFMQMIEEAIEENTEKAASAKDSEQPARLPFVERVVHIRFNAWHYLDANLWASLVTHIFRELHRQSSNKQKPLDWLGEVQVNELIDRLEVMQTVEKDARKELIVINSNIETARGRLALIEDEKAGARKDLIGKYALALSDALLEPVRAKLDTSVATLGLPEGVATVDQLSELASEARTLGGRVKLLLSTATKGSCGARKFMFRGLAVFVVCVAGATAIATQTDWGKEFVGQVGLFVSVLAGATAWLIPHLKRVNETLTPLFDAHKKVVKKQDERERELAVTKAKALETLDKLNAEQANKERELETGLLERERLEEIARGDRPTELLARFIEDRASAEGYRKHLGLLSHIRRDFEAMSKLMAEQRRLGADQNEDAKLPRIDRIVLYIDDLDRCRDQQVVEVLEAIHLLLAFDLFVVVVGVDARWLRHSLKQFYDQQLSVAEKPEEGRATVADYLEKIFQVPFHLRPLEFDQGGNYSRLVIKLVGDVTTSEAGDEDTSGDGGGESKNGERKVKSGGLRTVDLALPERVETPDETLQRVTLSDRELGIMKTLGPLVGRSPRAVKRFVNLYRLMRTRRRGQELETFLAEPGGGTALCEVYLLWLALEIGLTPQQLKNIIAVLDHADPEYSIDVLTIAVDISDFRSEEDPKSGGSATLRHSLWAALDDIETREALHDAIENAADVKVSTLRDVIAEVSRYSFRMSTD